MIDITGDSRVITSNQQGLNEKLDEVVLKHLQYDFKKPYQTHTLEAFKEVEKWVEQQGKPIIFDSCCGVGESTFHIANAHPEAIVLGMDKSADRLSKHPSDNEQVIQTLDNYRLLQVNLNDFWRLAVEAEWTLSHHYLLYPNPWPKAKHLQRRWHGSAVFPSIIKLGGKLDLRSNWFTYVEEFQRALSLANVESHIDVYRANQAITPFERKYWASGQQSLRLLSDL
ncbi:SAM-dependent methyltransferase [Psychromonas sp. 14N.309.X.WAT.B.A12]|uniref:tRNA (guanine(46)-N(7))-methyltransferase TrmB n=1 Tax=Psychromonas sp. 14N.309.X.WAT.B.A12 TaxID=2998322 RepID=UPI0025B07B08|nr:SAM-dependent methyltransferase [Psychromonas sp. 14N.309.X.WAT.B.A12]MDN2665029.1 SAM-dependent methyltransferase [Psychromonas sp. 14N.309.X.WAT.B.A12]